jgi:hypothetical protein
MAAAEKFVSDGGQIYLFEPLEPRFDLAWLAVSTAFADAQFFPRAIF